MIKGQDGFTLMEILVAVMILGIVAATFSSLFGFSISSISGAGERHLALLEAQVLLEQALVDPTMGELVGIYRQSMTSNGVNGELITAKVIWHDRFGGQRELELSVLQADQDQ